MSEVKKVASRFLLPLEFYVGFMAIAWAFSGGMGRGLLHEILMDNGDSTSAWMLGLAVVGIVQCSAAITEWFMGRRWYFYQLLWSAKVRTAVAFLSVLTWLWIVKMMLDTNAWERVFVLILIAPATVLVQGWICWENYRVRLVVDEDVPTSTMKFTR